MLGGPNLFGSDEDNDICRCPDFGSIAGSFNLSASLCASSTFDKTISGASKRSLSPMPPIVFRLITGVGLLLYFSSTHGGNADKALRDDFLSFLR